MTSMADVNEPWERRPLVSLEQVVAIVIPMIAGLAWLFRLEGRVNSHEASCTARQQQLDERHQAIARELGMMQRKLDRLLEIR